MFIVKKNFYIALMFRKLTLLLFLLSIILFSLNNALGAQNPEAKYNVQIYDFEGIRPLLEKDNDTTYVINFWATWCSPCVREIPYFDKINSKFAEKKVKVILISLDFPNQYDTRLIPFLKERQIKSRVILLDDPRANRWIPLVSEKWTGAIPATLIYNSHGKEFYQKVFTYEELENEVLKFISN